MRLLIIPILALFLLSCEKEEQPVITEPPAAELKPSLSCGTSWTLDCLDSYWDVRKSPQANVTIVPNGYNGHNSLLLYNPHDPFKVNPPSLGIETFIKNIKKDAPYRISFYAKIKGYPDYVSNPGLAAYIYEGNDWYDEMYYGSKGGEFHNKDWSKYSFTIIGKEAPTVNFELYSTYDSTWISDLKIEAL